MTDEQREEIARILEMIAEGGLPHPRNLDAALDAISDAFHDRITALEKEIADLKRERAHDNWRVNQLVKRASGAEREVVPQSILVPGGDHSYRWTPLRLIDVCVSDDLENYEEFVGKEHVPDGFFVVKMWVAE